MHIIHNYVSRRLLFYVDLVDGVALICVLRLIGKVGSGCKRMFIWILGLHLVRHMFGSRPI